MMFRLMLAISLMMICMRPDTAAQTTNDLITLVKGQHQTLSFVGMTGAGVGNINVLYIHDRKLNEVVISGASVGETTLEIYQRGGQKKRLTVRVLPLPLPGTQTSSQTAIQTSNEVIPEVADTAAVSATDVRNARPLSEPTTALTRPAQRERTQGLSRSALSRLEVSMETIALSDKERVRMVSAELIDPGKLREAISADAVERLATSPNREQTMTVRRSSVATMFSLRYEMSDRNPLTFIVPFIRRRDEISLGGNLIKTRSRGFGDIQIKFERLYPRLYKSAWDGTVEVNVGLPTGKSIYHTGANQSPLGTGHYEVGGTLGVRRVFDPLAFNAAVGVSYAIPRTIEGTRIAPGFGYQMQTGVAYAVTDKVAITQSLQYTRSPNVFLSIPTDAQTVNTDQAYLRHGLVFNPRGGHTIRMMFTVGLNPESLNHGFGVMYSFRQPSRTPE